MTSFRLLITGSRNANPLQATNALRAQFKSLVEYCEQNDTTPVVIHGGAHGVDSLAQRVAEEFQAITTIRVPAQWDKYGKAAGYLRNEHMVTKWKPHACLAITTGSPGTQHTIDLCAKHEVPTRVIEVEEQS